MSAHAYQLLLKRKNRDRLDKARSYINNRSRGIWNFLTYRADSMTLDKMVHEVRSSIPSLQEKEVSDAT